MLRTKKEIELYEQLKKVTNEKILHLIDFNKTILIMLSTVLSVLISFYNGNVIKNKLSIVIFIITIALFAISILFGSLYLYGFFKLKRKEEVYIVKLLEAEITGKETKGVEIMGVGEVYEWFGKLFYLFSILSLISLVTYSILKVF